MSHVDPLAVALADVDGNAAGAHHITREQPGSDMRYRCSCGWATPWGRPGNASHGAAAVRHAGGIGKEGAWASRGSD